LTTSMQHSTWMKNSAEYSTMSDRHDENPFSIGHFHHCRKQVTWHAIG
jgi:hypothetical protein